MAAWNILSLTPYSSIYQLYFYSLNFDFLIYKLMVSINLPDLIRGLNSKYK